MSFGSYGENNWGKDVGPTDFDENAVKQEEPEEILWVHLRGLPYRCTEDEIIKFLEIPKENVHRCGIEMNQEGRPSGDAYVACNTRSSAEQVLTKHRETFPGSRRYVEIFDVSENAAEKALAGSGGGGFGGNFKGGRGGGGGGRSGGGGFGGEYSWDGIVKMRGLPFKSSITDVEEFFSGKVKIKTLVKRV